LFCGQGGCQVYRKKYFNKVGGFKEDYFLYCEDSDLSWRLRNALYFIEPCWSAEIRHTNFASEESKARSVYYSHRNNVYSIWNNNPKIVLLDHLPFVIGGQLMCFVINLTHLSTVLKAKIDAIKGVRGKLKN